jgi:RND family efflux transporter MFP subunit
VVERHVHTGHLVTTGGQGQAPLLVVMRADPIRVMVDVPEADAAWIGPRTKVEIRLPGGASPPYVGTVTRTGWALHETARTLLAEIDVPNADDRWRPGQYLQVKLTVAEREDAIVLPKTALVMQDKQTFCHVVQADKTVARRPIALGINTGTEFEVVSGLTGDEVVILLNANAFREGQTVEVAAPAK